MDFDEFLLVKCIKPYLKIFNYEYFWGSFEDAV